MCRQCKINFKTATTQLKKFKEYGWISGDINTVWLRLPRVPSLEDNMSNDRKKIISKWYYLAGASGTVLTTIGLLWGLWAHFDSKSHDREMAELAKSDVEINIDVPDINMDKTVQDVRELQQKAQEAVSEKRATTTEAIKDYWRSSRDIFKMPHLNEEDYNSNVCNDPELSEWILVELYDDMCG